MNTRSLPKAVLVAAVASAVAALAVQLLLPSRVSFLQGFGGVDYNVYRAAAQVVLDHKPLYDHALTHNPDLGFTYPPFAVLAFLPMAALPRLFGEVLHVIVTILALALVLGRTLESALQAKGRPRRDRSMALASVAFAVGAISLEPVQSTLWFGQLNIVLMALVFLDLLGLSGTAGASGSKPSRWRGFGVGLAAGLKLTPLIFLPYLLLTRQWRAAATAAGTFLATVALGFLVIPQDSAKFWSSVGQTTRIGPLAWPSNQAVEGTLARIWAPHDPPKALFYALALALGGAGLLLGAYACRKGEQLLAVILVGLVACVVSPIAWSHHWVWAAPLVVWLVARGLSDAEAPARRRLLLAAAALFLWMFVWPNDQSALSFARSIEPASIGVFWLQQGPPPLRNLLGAWYLYAYLAILFFSWRALRQRDLAEARPA